MGKRYGHLIHQAKKGELSTKNTGATANNSKVGGNGSNEATVTWDDILEQVDKHEWDTEYNDEYYSKKDAEWLHEGYLVHAKPGKANLVCTCLSHKVYNCYEGVFIVNTHGDPPHGCLVSRTLGGALERLKDQRMDYEGSYRRHGKPYFRGAERALFTCPICSSLTWDDILKRIGKGDIDYLLAQESQDSVAEIIHNNFRVHHRPGTPMVSRIGAHDIIVYCDEGIFGFSMNRDYAWLISSTVTGAFEHITGAEKGCEGPRKRFGEPYINYDEGPTWRSIRQKISYNRYEIFSNESPLNECGDLTPENILRKFQIHQCPDTEIMGWKEPPCYMVYCKEGIFSISTDKNSARLISSTLGGALEYMRNGGGYEGPLKSSGEPYFYRVQGGQDLAWDDILQRFRGNIGNTNQWGSSMVEEILTRFQIHLRPGFQTLTQPGSQATIAYCDEGVFRISKDKESACLISRSLAGALEYMADGRDKGSEGLLKRSGKPYFEELTWDSMIGRLDEKFWDTESRGVEWEEITSKDFHEKFRIHHVPGTQIIFLKEPHPGHVIYCSEGVFFVASNGHFACLMTLHLVEVLEYKGFSVNTGGPWRKAGRHYFSWLPEASNPCKGV